jgi:hypothetical protein
MSVALHFRAHMEISLLMQLHMDPASIVALLILLCLYGSRSRLSLIFYVSGHSSIVMSTIRVHEIQHIRHIQLTHICTTV